MYVQKRTQSKSKDWRELAISAGLMGGQVWCPGASSVEDCPAFILKDGTLTKMEKYIHTEMSTYIKPCCSCFNVFVFLWWTVFCCCCCCCCCFKGVQAGISTCNFFFSSFALGFRPLPRYLSFISKPKSTLNLQQKNAHYTNNTSTSTSVSNEKLYWTKAMQKVYQ